MITRLNVVDESKEREHTLLLTINEITNTDYNVIFGQK